MREIAKSNGFLKVVREDKENYKVIVECVCGNIKSVDRANWLGLKIRSCGCHGKFQATKRTRRAWTLMRYRCNTSTSPDFKHYGGRGIKITHLWDDFLVFFSDMGNCPDNKTIERLDVNKSYNSDNCIWADSKVQANNKRNSHFIEYNGVKKTVSLFAEEYNLKYSTLSERLKRGWSIKKSLTTQVRKIK